MTAIEILQHTPYPVYEITLTNLNNAAEISAVMKEFRVVNYVYTFVYQGTVIKHGISIDKKSNYGDRIYRQAGHLEGWKYRLQGPNGDDMRQIDNDYFQKTGKHLNRSGMKIVVRDLTNADSPSITDPIMHVKQLERQLIREYQDTYGHAPIGNIKDEAYIDSKTYVTPQVWATLFE
jgi:hypothetical protein